MSKTLLFVPILLGLLACDGDKEPVDSDSPAPETDADGDGFDTSEDCDDSDAAINPGAAELCNDLDDNCDGLVDSDLDGGLETATYYADGDGDGYGNPDVSVVDCEQPEGFTTDATDCNDSSADYHPGADEDDCADPNDYNCDGSVGYEDADGDRYPACLECDDTNAAVYPGANEVCNEVDDDCDGGIDDDAEDVSTWYIDYDGDTFGSDRYTTTACAQPEGYVAVDGDCDDASADSYPGGSEVCDDSDNDCDGTVDEPEEAADASTWYEDADGDGFGVETATTVSCDMPTGYADNVEDCDDADAAVNPDAEEICDEIDNDCSGTVDGSDASDASVYYVDADGDGFGLTDYAFLNCGSVEGYAEDGGDCDDSTADVYPGAIEVCNLMDDDCDGTSDEDDSADATTWYADLDGDGFGGTVGTTTSCDQPDGYGSDTSDCDDEDEQVNPDAQEICNDGLDNNCDESAQDCTQDLNDADGIILGEAANASTGHAVAVGDVNADGLDDILIGAPYEDSAATDAGAAYLVTTSVGTGTLSLASADAKLTGEASDYRAGISVAIGDLDSDGVDDLVVGSHRVTSSKSQRGAAYVLFGPVSGSASLSTRDIRYLGEAAFDRAGIGVATGGDLNGDGEQDLLVGAYTADGADGGNTGLVYVLYGGFSASTADLNLSAADADLEGVKADDSIGNVLELVGDVDGDGADDFVVGCAGDDTNGASAGAVYLVTDAGSSHNLITDVAISLYGEEANDFAGTATSAAGDVDGDGYEDILVGAYGDDTTGDSAGAVYLMSGDISGTTVSLADYMAKFLGDSTSDQLGAAVSGGGDVNGDGTPDLLFGATADEDGGSGAGAAYLVYGPTTGELTLATDADAKLYGSEIGMSAGAPVDVHGDYDGDGRSDLLIGASNHDGGGTDAGALFLLYAVDQ